MNDTKFVKSFENRIKKTIRTYKLINAKDRLAVACSGGKDSTAVLYVLDKLGYKVEAMTVDALIGNYTKENLKNIRKFCKSLKIKLNVISFREEFGCSLCYIKSLLNSKGINLKSCTICGVLRRYLLNKYAKKFKFTKIVTGHNLDDECQSFIMNLFKNELELTARSGPATGTFGSKNFVKRIKPLYLTQERDVKRYSELMNFPVKYGACPCRVDSYRNYIREVLDNYEKNHPKFKQDVIKVLLRLLPKLKNDLGPKKDVLLCSKCGEPSKGKLCKACEIISKLH